MEVDAILTLDLDINLAMDIITIREKHIIQEHTILILDSAGQLDTYAQEKLRIAELDLAITQILDLGAHLEDT